MASLSGACCRASNAAAAARRVLQHVTYTGRASLHSGGVVTSLALWRCKAARCNVPKVAINK